MQPAVQHNPSPIFKGGLYHPTPVATLHAETGVNFDLYMLIPSRNSKHFILFKSASIDLSPQKRWELITNGVKTLYVRDSDTEKYVDYVDRTLGRKLASDKTSPQEKSKILYTTTTELMKASFVRPDSPILLKANKAAVTHTVSTLSAEPRMLRTLASMFSLDYSLYTHSVNVSTLATGLLLEIQNLPQNEVRDIAMGFLLHDIGKSRIPIKILQKPDNLSAEETKEIRKHPEYGVQLMKIMKGMPRRSLDIIMNHHEKLNGSGYPRHLTAENISLESRICAAADVFDALTSHRVYKPAVTGYEAMKFITDRMSHEIDRDIVHVLIKLLGPNETRFV